MMTMTGDDKMRILLWIYILIGCAITTLKALVISTSEEQQKYSGHLILVAIEAFALILNVFIWPFNTTFEIKNVKK